MSAMSDLDITLQLGEPVPCECSIAGCQAAIKVHPLHKMVWVEWQQAFQGWRGDVYLTPATAQALAILLSEAGRDAAGH